MSLESLPKSEHISCANCVAACCRAGGSLMLDSREYQLHRAAMKLKTIVRPSDRAQKVALHINSIDGSLDPQPITEILPAGVGVYTMGQDCNRLDEDNRCSIYGDPSRPKACHNYEVGSDDCLAARARAGLDS